MEPTDKSDASRFSRLKLNENSKSDNEVKKLPDKVKKIDVKPPPSPTSFLARNAALVPSQVARLKQISPVQTGLEMGTSGAPAASSGSATGKYFHPQNSCSKDSLRNYKLDESKKVFSRTFPPQTHESIDETIFFFETMENVDCEKTVHFFRSFSLETQRLFLTCTLLGVFLFFVASALYILLLRLLKKKRLVSLQRLVSG